MANLSGTNVAAAVRPFTDADTYATAVANEIKGGNHTANTLLDRNNISVSRREIGMLCYVVETQTRYKLINNPVTASTTNVDWEVEVDANSILIDGKSLLENLNELKKEERTIAFMINTVKIGTDNIGEFVSPFTGSIHGIIANVPKSTTLTKSVTFNIEKYVSGGWVSITSAEIKTTDGNAITNTFETSIDIDILDTLRINIIDCQQGLKNLTILVNLVTTN